MRPDRRGLAGLFDALVFLAIASLVSVSLLSALGGAPSATEERGGMIDAAHSVLLRSTVTDPQGNPVTIEEFFKLHAQDPAGCEDDIIAILDLLLPGTEWRWSVERPSWKWACGSEATTSGAVYCSTVRAPIDGCEVVYRLEAWAVQS